MDNIDIEWNILNLFCKLSIYVFFFYIVFKLFIFFNILKRKENVKLFLNISYNTARKLSLEEGELTYFFFLM